ncbi:MAG: S1 RNA-binding domain-containing protein [Candidatus Gastranaerophilales bacterium]|nr:S1 RNA-binding domain-containing protein [Candidatus Gastranaerophilales bacterium]
MAKAVKEAEKNQSSMSEFEKLLSESFDYNFKVADVVNGTVVRIEKNGVLVDIGSKAEAIVPLRELSNVPFDGAESIIAVGEKKEFYILKEEDEDGQITLSLKRVSHARNWLKLDDLRQKNETITAKVFSLVKGGVVVEVFGLRGFVPASQLRTGTPHEGLIGQEIPVKILETDPKRNKLILSQRQALAEERERVVVEVISKLDVDQIVEGEVVRIADFGAFIDINGVDGLLPISEISWQRVKHPSSVLTLGQKLEVKILKIDNELNRISLSLKRMEENPWVKIEDKFTEGQIIKGIVNKITSFGAFIDIFPGVEALLPVAEMSDRQINPFEFLSIGQEIEVVIKRFTPQEHRIGLSLKDLNRPKQTESNASEDSSEQLAEVAE